MDKIDLIIYVLEGYFDDRPLGLDKMHEALAAARELKALAQPEREWVGLTDDEIKKIMQRWRNGYIDIKDVEQLLKDKNT